MTVIGIRELRQHASRYLRLVAQGETIEVTDRRRPVARLVPVPSGDRIAELEAAGRLAAASGTLEELGSPLRPARGVPPPSELLCAAREMER
jgi:prevent-host-death family protein